ncbi:MAG: lytic murein transglycosylase [Acidobacteria bacterium Pan2503]|uniref:Lytic murein transglycosylase n=1 Tax=Candidatus Acidiferrum panamense TaxID=2741543 RepID=A0A7V8NWM2_9BACT|nr:lytic murein transglycosylase [Candidatus Acidoferrum panamensis]
MHSRILLIVLALLSSLPASRRNALAQNEPSSFSEWLAAVRAEALARGIRQDIVDQALGPIEEPLVSSIERDREQPETVLPLEAYIARRLRPATVRTGRQMLQRYRAVLRRVSNNYGVPAPVIVALWGMESNFGRLTGSEPTITVLATLAWDPRRGAFFRQELFDALDILNRGDIELSRMRGSWAGAMGQLQFMPSSYLKYAVDFDGDGRRDIWGSPADIFASIANYLKQHGWVRGRQWGREVKVPRSRDLSVPRRETVCPAARDMTDALPLEEWRRLGVRLPGGRPLPRASFRASLVTGSSRCFLLYANYDALLAYNCSHAYALSVGLLADRIAH